MNSVKPMTSSKPYLLRAIYDWLLDNDLTPYVMVDADCEGVSVPERYIENGRIVLNITPRAVGNFAMSNTTLEFDARFGGVAYHVYVPIQAVTAIYAYENGRGMVFSDDDSGGDGSPKVDPGDGHENPPPKKKGRPSLKIVK